MKKKRINWQKKKFFLLTAVVFSTSLGTGLAFSLESKETPFSPDFLNSGGSVLSQTKARELNSFPTKPDKEANNKKILVKTEQTFDLNQVSLEKEAKETVSCLVEVLKKNEPSLVYDFLGEDSKGIFRKDDFPQPPFSLPRIVQAEILNGPKVSGRWSEFIIKLTLEDQSEKEYFVVFHLEDGEWKLFGTQEFSS